MRRSGFAIRHGEQGYWLVFEHPAVCHFSEDLFFRASYSLRVYPKDHCPVLNPAPDSPLHPCGQEQTSEISPVGWAEARGHQQVRWTDNNVGHKKRRPTYKDYEWFDKLLAQEDVFHLKSSLLMSLSYISGRKEDSLPMTGSGVRG